MTPDSSQRRSEQGDLFGDRGAKLSTCGRYRYSLWRRWDPLTPLVVFVMLNPSTADALDDDLTITKCVGFARRWGAGGIRVVNLYAWRATNPGDLPVGVEAIAESQGFAILNRNDSAILSATADASRIIAAWGSHSMARARTPRVMDLLVGRQVEALALTKDGSPRHPSRLGYAVEPVVYREALRDAA